MSFNDYTAIPSGCRFSVEFFKSLTFGSVGSVSVPPLHEKGALVHWFHVDDLPPSTEDLLVKEGELIPNVEDLLDILKTMEVQYEKGGRGVLMRHMVEGKECDSIASYGKIRLIQVINNYAKGVTSARRLYSHLKTIRSFPEFSMDVFASHPVFAPIKGFTSAQFPLWELTYLIGEEWVHEDTLNALAEMVYLQFCVVSKHSPSKFLFLPTTFYDHARLLFKRGARTFSPNLIDIRNRLTSTAVDAVGFLILDNGHFSAVWMDSKGLFFADTLSHSPPNELVDVLTWVCKETLLHVPPSVEILPVPQQTYSAGNGSCGIAAHNFVHRHAFGNVAIWNPDRSSTFRDAALIELVLYHLCATDHSHHPSTWTARAMPEPEKTQLPRSPLEQDHSFYSYDDFNSLTPTMNHPIHAFISNHSWRVFDRRADVVLSSTGKYYITTPTPSKQKIEEYGKGAGPLVSPRKTTRSIIQSQQFKETDKSTSSPLQSPSKKGTQSPVKSVSSDTTYYPNSPHTPQAIAVRMGPLSPFHTPQAIAMKAARSPTIGRRIPQEIAVKTEQSSSVGLSALQGNAAKAGHLSQPRTPTVIAVKREPTPHQPFPVANTGKEEEVPTTRTPSRLTPQVIAAKIQGSFTPTIIPPSLCLRAANATNIEAAAGSHWEIQVKPPNTPTGLTAYTESRRNATTPPLKFIKPPEVIDLTLSPLLHRTVFRPIDITSSPVSRPLDHRSPSVIELSSDTDIHAHTPTGTTESDTDDPGKFWYHPTKSNKMRTGNLFGTPLSSDSEHVTPKPMRSKNFDAVGRLPATPPVPQLKTEDSTTSLDEPLRNRNSQYDNGVPQPNVFHPPARPPPRVDGIGQSVKCGSGFLSMIEARSALELHESKRGFQWKTAKTRLDPSGTQKKLVMRCRRAGEHHPVHASHLDPSDHRDGKSVKQGCMARANINRVGDWWFITRYDEDHNHDREIPPGLSVRRPPTSEQKEAMARLDSAGGFSRRQVGNLLKSQFPDHTLEPRQVSNVLNAIRREKRQEVEVRGGDFASILADLDDGIARGEMWNRRIMLDTNGVCKALFWQSPQQGDLSRRFNDLLLNDNSYNRNQYGYPLNIGIAIDSHGKSRNIWYAVHATEDAETHRWTLKCHADAAGRHPEAFFSDRSGALINAVAQEFPDTRHFFCLHHMLGNIGDRIRVLERTQAGADTFIEHFWSLFRAVSPNEFERILSNIIAKFPNCRSYIMNELYPCRRQWAWAWVGKEFTAGIRTNGRVEAENRVNKALGGPKKTLHELFKALNERAVEQSMDSLVRVRQSSRQKHPGNLEQVFAGPLSVVRAYAGPFALQTCYSQMEASLFYSCEMMPRPSESRQWNAAMLTDMAEPGFGWDTLDHRNMMNAFSVDGPYLSLSYLMTEVSLRNLTITHVLRIVHLGTGAIHHLMLLADMRYVCDCGMSMNLGIPCRHYFRALQFAREIPFHISLIRPRWFIDPTLDVSKVSPILLNSTIPEQNRDQIVVAELPPELRTNPLATAAAVPNIQALSTGPAVLLPDAHRDSQAPPPTQTISSREVFHELNAALRPLMNHVQTQEQLDNVLENIRGVRREHEESTSTQVVRDPPVIRTKGKPRSARITSAREGPARGGGGPRLRPRRTRPDPTPSAVTPREDDADDEADPTNHNGSPPRKRIRTYRCGICHQQGHNRHHCPSVGNR